MLIFFSYCGVSVQYPLLAIDHEPVTYYSEYNITLYMNCIQYSIIIITMSGNFCIVTASITIFEFCLIIKKIILLLS